jgi:hypothetical protein
MSTKFRFVIANLFFVIASTCSAQDVRLTGPTLNAPDLNGSSLNGPDFVGPHFIGPVELGPEAAFVQVPGSVIQSLPAGEFTSPNGISAPSLEGMPIVLSASTCAFFARVKYKNKGKIAPCAQTMVVTVLDPRSVKCDCETKFVQVKICAPLNGCPKVKISRTGRHTRYDYGKYAIDVYSNRNGTILVDYDA